MKILDKGKYSLPWEGYKITCSNNNCQAELLVEKSDIQARLIKSDYGNYYKYSFVCPICKNNMEIPDDNIPEVIKKEIEKRYERRKPDNDSF